jgi:hypothetical protein
MVLSDINTLISTRMELIKNRTNLWSAAARIEELSAIEIIK